MEVWERKEVGDCEGGAWVVGERGMFDRDEAAGGGPAERGEVGAKGSSKIVSVWALRVFMCGTAESKP